MKVKCMKKKVLSPMLLLFALSLFFGCSFAPYPTGDISKNPKVARYEFQSGEDLKRTFEKIEFKERKPDENQVVLVVSGIKSSIKNIEIGNRTFPVKYHRSLVHEAPNVSILVEFPNGRKYPAFLDTGAPGYIIMTTDIVLDNKLSIWPIDLNNYTVQGLCHIPELTVGAAKINDAIALYEEQQWQFRIMNVPVFKLTAIILGRDFIKSFDYVMFDNVHKQAVFSKEGAFVPDNPELWLSYSFYEDPNRESTIMVKIPIAGHILDVAFDSCGAKPGLELSKEHWQDIQQDLSYELHNKFIGVTYQGIKMSLQRATISKISIGAKTIKNADINVCEEPNQLSIFSLGYFQDTIIVLDFVNHLFWIKK
jgi:hypothetical protein